MNALKNTIRPYKNYSLNKMLRLKLFFTYCKHEFLINNIAKVYENAAKIFSARGTNNLIGALYGDILLGGTTVKDLETCVKIQKQENIACISGFIREGLTKAEEADAIDEVMNNHLESIDIVSKYDPKNFIAIKVSCFCNKEALKLLNKVQRDLIAIEEYFHMNRTDLDKFRESLYFESARKNLNENTLAEIRDNLFKGSKHRFTLNLYEMICNNEQNKIDIVKNLFGEDLPQDLIDYVHVIDSRINKVISHASTKKCSILMDAEETYFQDIIDVLIMHYLKIYNREFPLLLHTIQCYLKRAPRHLEEYITFIRENNLRFGLKLVKGAYLKIETKMALEEKRENPVNNTIEETQNQYNAAVDRLIGLIRTDEKVIFASHNFSTIEKICDIMAKRSDIFGNVWVAQLLGMSEHASLYSSKCNVQTAKYLPYGSQHIMIPYLIRRAEESAIMRNLQIQNNYLNKEFKHRLVRNYV